MVRHAVRGVLLALPFVAGAAVLARPAAPAPAHAQAGDVRAYRFARLVDGTGTITTDAVIVVANGRVRSVGSGVAALPRGVPLTDLRPLTAIPGLVDLHTHMTYWWDRAPGTQPFGASTRRTPAELAIAASDNGRLTLETGVTTARDLGASGYADVRMKERFARGEAVGPRLIVAGFGLQKVTPPAGGAAAASALPNAPPGWRRARITSLVDIDSAVKAQVDSGADVIKMYGSRGTGADTTTTQTFTFEEMRAAVQAARRYGKRIAIHSYGESGGRDAVRAGATTVEHAVDLDDSTLALMRRQGTIYVPTMDHNRYYADFRRDYGYSDAQAAGLDAFRARNLATTRRAIRAGVKVGMGSDAVHMMFGQNTRELGLLVDAGMTPLQALRAGTLTGAEALGLEDRLGRVAPGYLADIVAVDGNPATSVRAIIDGVRWVMKDGAVVVDTRDGAPRLDSLAMVVSRPENRAVAFTNQRAAYFSTQTHGNDHHERPLAHPGDALDHAQRRAPLLPPLPRGVGARSQGRRISQRHRVAVAQWHTVFARRAATGVPPLNCPRRSDATSRSARPRHRSAGCNTMPSPR
jgi:imidazolonepropionase-like amidohydrolase